MRHEVGLVESRPFQIAATSRVQQQSCQQQQGNQRKEVAPKRQFTRIGMSLAQVLQLMLEGELITLKAPPRNPNTAAPSYRPKQRCAYHSDGPGHDTNNCWALKNRIQDLFDEGVLEFTQDDQLELFYHLSRAST